MLTGISGSKQVHSAAMMRWRKSSICSQVSGSAGAAGALCGTSDPTVPGPAASGLVAGPDDAPSAAACFGCSRDVPSGWVCICGILLFELPREAANAFHHLRQPITTAHRQMLVQPEAAEKLLHVERQDRVGFLARVNVLQDRQEPADDFGVAVS